MPQKNSVKQYLKNGYYHVYNRGVEKRSIFLDTQDYQVFLRFLKEYLLPPKHPDLIALQGLNPRRTAKNYFADIELLCYCLMPNHFHLELRQKSDLGLQSFMKALLTNYSMYFNRKYNRVGHLFQGIYKASMIMEDPYLVHLSRYIHLNPNDSMARVEPLQEYRFSSYADYLGLRKTEWVNTTLILSIFNELNKNTRDSVSYQKFVEDIPTSTTEDDLAKTLYGLD